MSAESTAEEMQMVVVDGCKSEVASVAAVPRSLALGIRSLRTSSQLCDVVLVVGEESFPAHQAMLCAMSPVFGALLQDAASEQTKVSDGVPVASTQSGVALAIAPDPEPRQQEPLVQKQCSKPEIEESEDTTLVRVASAETQFEDTTSSQSKPLQLHVSGVSHGESVRITLDYIYEVGTGGVWQYNPSTREVNKEVLHLAQKLHLRQLQEHAARWLAIGLTVENVLETLVTCEEFKLGRLREKLIEQLTAQPSKLSVLCQSPAILSHPSVLQDLLVQVSSLCGMVAEETTEKKEEKVEKPLKKRSNTMELGIYHGEVERIGSCVGLFRKLA